jgi:hypothetical protein
VLRKACIFMYHQMRWPVMMPAIRMF